MSPRRSVLACLALFWALAAPLWAKPTLFIIGDSTVRNGTSGQMGWGDPLVRHFDPAKIEVVNRAIGGRSSRTFLTEGRWDAVMANLKPGDFVLVQFGHNDGGPVNDDRCRASLKGIGEESEKIIGKIDGREETVHTYGWYLRKYASDAKSKGAVPILVSPIPRNIWKNGRLDNGSSSHSLWVRQVAASEKLLIIDFNNLLANRYEALGPDGTARLFAGTDHTHTGPQGAEFNAAVMVEAIRSLKDCYLSKGLLPGDLWLPSVFSDHMVLQRDMPVPVWGRAAPGAEISVRLGPHAASGKADENGDWRADFPASSAGGPFTLEVMANGISRRIFDVMLGEVWLLAGQTGADGLPADSKRSQDFAQPRIFEVSKTLREFPQRDVAGKWIVGSPVMNPARQPKVPVGIIACACEDGSAESWIRREVLEAHPQFGGLLKDFDRKQMAFRDHPKAFEQYGLEVAKGRNGPTPRHPDPVQDPRSPGVLHNGMIAPLIPYAIRAAIWTPVETKDGASRHPEFRKALLDDWRGLWHRPTLSFRDVLDSGSKRQSSGGFLNSEKLPIARIPATQ